MSVDATAAAENTGGSSSVSLWLRIPEALLSLYKLELPYNGAFHAGPDTFALPNVACEMTVPGDTGSATRGLCEVSVQPNHRHSGARWPMLVYNGSIANYRGCSFPQESWDASPESYLVFVHAQF